MIRIILGAPCSGKSTYVQEHRKDGDVVVDFDKLAAAFGSNEKHSAPDAIKNVAFKARDAAISLICDKAYDAWIIHTSPTEAQRKLYEEAGAEFIELDTDLETCLARCEADERPEGTAEVIRGYFEGKEKKMKKKVTVELKSSNGTISGYAATFIREPDFYGDVIAKGAFVDCIARLKEEEKVLPLLWNHDSYSLNAYIGTVINLEEDDHGLKFDATFDDTKEAQRARELASDGRLCKFSFAYDVLESGEITLPDGRKANELRKLNIHEVSLVMYPANDDTSVIDVKSGRRNSKADSETLKEITEHLGAAQTLINSLLADDDKDPEEGEKAKSKEPDPANDEEQKRLKGLLEKANEILADC